MREKVVLTAYFSGDGHEIHKQDFLVSLLMHHTQADNETSFKIGFDGVGITNGFMGGVFASGLEDQCFEVIRQVQRLLDAGKKVIVNCCAHSHGAIGALFLAKFLGTISSEYLETNLVLADPVPGNLITSATTDVLGLTTANKAKDLRHSQNLKSVLCIYPYQPVTGFNFETSLVAVFHAPLFADYPEKCQVTEEVVPGCHALAQSLSAYENQYTFNSAPFVSFVLMKEFLEKNGTHLDFADKAFFMSDNYYEPYLLYTDNIEAIDINTQINALQTQGYFPAKKTAIYLIDNNENLYHVFIKNGKIRDQEKIHPKPEKAEGIQTTITMFYEQYPDIKNGMPFKLSTDIIQKILDNTGHQPGRIKPAQFREVALECYHNYPLPPSERACHSNRDVTIVSTGDGKYVNRDHKRLASIIHEIASKPEVIPIEYDLASYDNTDCSLKVETGFFAPIKRFIRKHPVLVAIVTWLIIAAIIATTLYFTGGLGAIPLVGGLLVVYGPVIIPILTPFIAVVASAIWNIIIKPICSNLFIETSSLSKKDDSLLQTLINWFKSSGIVNSWAEPKRPSLQGQEIVDDLNPLAAVVENPKHWLARIYRESVWRGIADTYHVLVGDHYDLALNGKGRKGILDILLFPSIGRRLMGFAFNPQHDRYFRIIAAIPAFLLEIPRGIIGGLGTLALSPAVAVVHVVTYFKASKLKETAGNLQIAVTKETDKKTYTTTLLQFMQENNLSLSDIKARKVAEGADLEYCTPGAFFKPQKADEGAAQTVQQQSRDAFDELNIGGLCT
jgi:hypothetical protein